MLLKTSFLLSHLFWNVRFEFSWFHNMEKPSDILILKMELMLEFQNKTNIEIIGFLLMHFEFVLKTSWKMKNCYAEDVLKASSRHVLKTSWRLLENQQMFPEIILQLQRKF